MTAGRISRRGLLAGLAALPLALQAACSGDEPATESNDSAAAAPEEQPPTPTVAPTATATPEPPFVFAAGEQTRPLMAGTDYETRLLSFGSGLPGDVIMVLGGVHGNEPGGWLAAEQVAAELRPSAGALVVVPRANRIATELFVRTTDEMGDLNRLYPGDPDGLPMARMAAELVAAMREFHVTTVLDLHESWAFYRDRTETETGTAYLGQTVSTYPAEPGRSLARALVEAVNANSQAPQEELTFRERGPRGGATDGFFTGQAGTGGIGRSSLALPSFVPGISAILIEMGQQQALERRIALHVDSVREAMRLSGI